MTTIASVIGWKFNNQPGMSTENGVITDFPGGIPSQTDQDTWTTEYETWKAAMDEIDRLEAEVTQRRIRDAFADPAWMNAQEAKIKTERDKL